MQQAVLLQCADYGVSQEVSYLRRGVQDNPVSGFQYMLSCLPEYDDSQRKDKTRLFFGEDVRCRQSNVWQNANAENLDRSENKPLRYSESQRKVGERDSRDFGQDWGGISIRTEELQTCSRYDIPTRFLYSCIRFMDRNWGRDWKEEKESFEVISKKLKLLADSTPSPLLFGTEVVGSIRCSDVVDVPVFNLEVEEDESYVAEGIAVHNCRTEPVIIS